MEEQYKDIQQVVKEAGIHRPSSDFLTKVMQEVHSSSQKSYQYTPLISKKGWTMIIVIVSLIIAVLFFLPIQKTPSIIRQVNFSWIEISRWFNPFSEVVIYKTATYGIVLLGILFFVQITLLKKRIDKNFSV